MFKLSSFVFSWVFVRQMGLEQHGVDDAIEYVCVVLLLICILILHF